MSWFDRLDTSRRHVEPEIMDDPALDRTAHEHALSGLARINRWTRIDRIFWPAIAAMTRSHRSRPLRILDVATGSADLPIRLLERASARGVNLQIDA